MQSENNKKINEKEDEIDQRRQSVLSNQLKNLMLLNAQSNYSGFNKFSDNYTKNILGSQDKSTNMIMLLRSVQHDIQKLVNSGFC